MDTSDRIETVLCDLDGVVWLAHQPIAGSVEAIERLRSHGVRVLFVTNNSAAVEAEHERALESIGVPARGDVVSSAMAAARLVEPSSRVLVAAGPGVVEAVERRGAEAVVNDGSISPEGFDSVIVGLHRDFDFARLVEPSARVLVAAGPGVVEAVERRGAVAVVNDGSVSPEGFDAVIVGLHRDFDFARLTVASAAVRAGAQLIGTNTDSTYPTPSGLQPGGGSILAAIATASDATPLIGGKPHQPMVDLIAATVGTPRRPFDPSRVLMVGDRPETDGLFAQRLGCRFALVRSGVSETGAVIGVDIAVEIDVADLAEVASRIMYRP